MLTKVEVFKTRIFQNNKVYLLARDVAQALGYEKLEDFMNDNTKYVELLDSMPPLITEYDFNVLLLQKKEAFEKLQHFEITRVETLRAKTEIQKGLYPIKKMIAHNMFEEKAKELGMSSVNEYIEKVDYPNEVRRAMDELITKRDVLREYSKMCSKLLEPEYLDKQVLEKYGLAIQSYTRIQNGSIYLESFIVGKGIFYMLSLGGDEFYTGLSMVNGELYIPEYDYQSEGISMSKIGIDPTGREYREHGVFENIRFILEEKDIQDAGVDLLECSQAGVKLYISSGEAFKLLNPNMYREVILLEGIIDFEQSVYLTDTMIET